MSLDRILLLVILCAGATTYGGQHSHAVHYYYYIDGPIYNHFPQEDDRVYRFQIGGGGDFGPYDYIDPADGVHKGFEIDLLWAVCQEAGKQCTFVSDRSTNCWYVDGNRQLPGVGLLNNYYDGCMGYLPTAERQNSFNFSVPYTPNFAIGLYYKAGAIAGDATDLTGRRIGFVKGWAMSRACLTRQTDFKGTKEGDYRAVFYSTPKKLVEGILTGEVDAIWTFKANYNPQSLELQAVGPDVYCSSAGVSVMARYSKQRIINWWNEAFQRMVATGQYRKLCEQAQQTHGHRGGLYCVD